MLIIETNYGDFGSFKDILTCMKQEGIEEITIQRATYCTQCIMKMPITCTIAEIQKVNYEMEHNLNGNELPGLTYEQSSGWDLEQ